MTRRSASRGLKRSLKVVATEKLVFRLDSRQNRKLWSASFDPGNFADASGTKSARGLANRVSRKFQKAVEKDRKAESVAAGSSAINPQFSLWGDGTCRRDCQPGQRGACSLFGGAGCSVGPQVPNFPSQQTPSGRGEN